MAAHGIANSLRLLLREALHSPWVCMSAFGGDEPARVAAPTRAPTGDPVLVLGGFLSHPSYYASLSRALTRAGHATVVDEGINAVPFREHVKRLAGRAAEIADQRGRPVRLIGHSLGGLHAMALLARRPDVIGQVIAVASPVVGGTPWLPLQHLVERVLQVQGEDTARLRRLVAPYAARITTISAPEDLVAPPETCALDGAANVVLSTLPGADRYLASHTGVIFMRTAVRVMVAHLRRPVWPVDSLREAV